MKDNNTENREKIFRENSPCRIAFFSSLFRIRDAIVDRSTEADKDKEGTIQRGFRVADVRVDSTCFSPSMCPTWPCYVINYKVPSRILAWYRGRTGRNWYLWTEGKFYNFFRSKFLRHPENNDKNRKFHSGYFYNFSVDILC